MTFAALEARVNGVVMARLSNATAKLANGTEVPTIFDRAFVEALNGRADMTQPMCVLNTGDVAVNGITFGSQITLPDFGEFPYGNQAWWGGSTFKVRSLHPDGTGLTTLILEEA